jgi:hypothetical protein
VQPVNDNDAPPRELGPGECFGEQALLDDGEVPVAVALADTQCLSLTRDTFGQDSGQASGQSIQPRVSTWRQPYVWIGQQEAADCGIAVLAMVARALGMEVSLSGLRHKTGTLGDGLNLAELQRVGAALGLRCLAARVTADQFQQFTLPAIVHLQSAHYVVLYEFAPEHVVIGDPEAGILRLGREAFLQACSGNVLLIRTPDA